MSLFWPVTRRQSDEVIASQGYACAICGNQPAKGRLGIDHDHATGFVRGALCGQCNTGLGSFRDNQHLLLAAIGYLQKARLEGEFATPDAAPYAERVDRLRDQGWALEAAALEKAALEAHQKASPLSRLKL